jgi:hypothetical protein
MFALILIAVVVIMYGRTLKYGLCIDSFEVAKRSVGKEKPKSFWVRLYLSWQGIYYNSKELPMAHAITFLLHLGNSLMVYYAFGHNWISFLTAILFCIHPAGTQGSVWLSGKAYSTAVFCTLLMYSTKWFAPIFYYCAFTYGGFSATFTPLIFITSKFWPIAFVIPFAVILIFKKRIKDALGAKWKITPASTRKPSLKRIILYFKTLGYYTCLSLVPLRLGVYHNYLYTYGLTEADTKKWHKPDLYAVLGLAVFAFTGYCFFAHYSSPVTLGLVWFLILISQWCNFPTTLQQAIAERYLNLPLVGAMYALVNGIYLIPDPTIRAFLLGAFIIGFAVRLNVHIPSYRNIHFQIDHNLVNFPECYAIWTWKGQEEKNRGAFFTALEAWFQGWKLRKIDFRLNNNIAVLLTQVGQLDQAKSFLKLAEQNIPPDQKEAGMEYIRNGMNDILEVKRQADLDARKNKSNIILPGGNRNSN